MTAALHADICAVSIHNIFCTHDIHSSTKLTDLDDANIGVTPLWCTCHNLFNQSRAHHHRYKHANAFCTFIFPTLLLWNRAIVGLLYFILIEGSWCSLKYIFLSHTLHIIRRNKMICNSGNQYDVSHCGPISKFMMTPIANLAIMMHFESELYGLRPRWP